MWVYLLKLQEQRAGMFTRPSDRPSQCNSLKLPEKNAAAFGASALFPAYFRALVPLFYFAFELLNGFGLLAGHLFKLSLPVQNRLSQVQGHSIRISESSNGG